MNILYLTLSLVCVMLSCNGSGFTKNNSSLFQPRTNPFDSSQKLETPPDSPIVKSVKEALIENTLGQEVVQLLHSLEKQQSSVERKKASTQLKKELYILLTANATLTTHQESPAKKTGETTALQSDPLEEISQFKNEIKQFASSISQLPTFDKVSSDEGDVPQRILILHMLEMAVFHPEVSTIEPPVPIEFEFSWGELVNVSLNFNDGLFTCIQTAVPLEQYIQEDAIAGSWVKFLREFHQLIRACEILICKHGNAGTTQNSYLKRLSCLSRICTVLKKYARKKALSSPYQEAFSDIKMHWKK